MRYLLVIFIVTSTFTGWAQSSDSIPARRNTIKLNLVTGLIYSNSVAVSYEHVTKPHQSWSATLGYVRFPKLGDLSSGIGVTDDQRSGYVLGGEYRFYLQKENKYLAPHGVFIGPYANYFFFHNSRTITSADGLTEAILKSDLSALNIGVQLGYQFVIHDRWTIDLVFLGPSISRYALKLDLEGDIDDSVLENDIIGALADRFPVVKDLISGETVNLHGKSSKWAGGFRYQLNVGYHFGGGKKKK